MANADEIKNYDVKKLPNKVNTKIISSKYAQIEEMSHKCSRCLKLRKTESLIDVEYSDIITMFEDSKFQTKHSIVKQKEKIAQICEHTH